MHHAYLFEGAGVSPEIVAFLKTQQLAIEGTPDASVFAYERLGVDEVRRIVSRSQLKPFTQSHHVIVVSFANATAEAQNAFLKTLEEPSPSALFILITPQIDALLPTVLSRVERVPRSAPVIADEAKIFLKSSLGERLEMIKDVIGKDAETDERQLQRMLHFLSSLEHLLGTGGVRERQEGVRALYRVRRFAMMPGAPLKALFEQLAILL